MRLIDADKIPFVISENGCLDDYAYRYDINELPTIDQVKHGRWIYRQLTESLGAFHCSVCHTTWDTETNYCPNCGSKMDADKTEATT